MTPDRTSVRVLRAAVLPAVTLAAITVGTLPAAASAMADQPSAPARAAAACLNVQTLTFSSAQDAATQHLWTPARIAAARGFSQAALGTLDRPQRTPQGAWPTSATQCVPQTGLTRAVAATAPSAARSAPARNGYPTVGKLTFDADGVLSLNCTATVINGTAAANSEELIVTAAHCIEGTTGGIPYTSTHLAFSPMWHDNQNPYGTWTVKKVFLNSGWMKCIIPLVDCSTNPQYDYAILVLNPQHGKGVGDITGANGWSVNQPASVGNVAIAGIPGTSSHTLFSMTNTVTVTESGNPYRKGITPGLTDGSSGGPWFKNFNTTTGRGLLLADTGGYEQGGPPSGSPSYASYWRSAFAAIVGNAVNYEG